MFLGASRDPPEIVIRYCRTSERISDSCSNLSRRETILPPAEQISLLQSKTRHRTAENADRDMLA